jgi:hypothetical protein
MAISVTASGDSSTNVATVVRTNREMNILILLEIQHQKTGADSPLNRSGLSE